MEKNINLRESLEVIKNVAGMVAGVLRFPIWKFLLARWFGKALLYVGVTLAGAWGWEALLRYFG